MSKIKVVKFANGKFHYVSDDGLCWYKVSKAYAQEMIMKNLAKMT